MRVGKRREQFAFDVDLLADLRMPCARDQAGHAVQCCDDGASDLQRRAPRESQQALHNFCPVYRPCYGRDQQLLSGLAEASRASRQRSPMTELSRLWVSYVRHSVKQAHRLHLPSLVKYRLSRLAFNQHRLTSVFERALDS